MEGLDKHQTKTVKFMSALINVYKDEDDREELSKLDLVEEELTDDFTAMLQALHLTYSRMTGDDVDLIGFTHILNRLAMQELMVPKNDVEVN